MQNNAQSYLSLQENVTTCYYFVRQCLRKVNKTEIGFLTPDCDALNEEMKKCFVIAVTNNWDGNLSQT